MAVRALNGVDGRPTQGGLRRPPDPAFGTLVEAWRRIQLSRSFSMRVEQRGDDPVTIGVFAKRLDPEVRRDLALIGRILGLTPREGEIVLTYAALPQAPNELAVLSRSMIEIFNEIASDIEVPQAHVVAGRTYGPASPQVQGGLARRPPVLIRSGASPPPEAFTAVRYRGSW